MYCFEFNAIDTDGDYISFFVVDKLKYYPSRLMPIIYIFHSKKNL
jgi:hypothetical protein